MDDGGPIATTNTTLQVVTTECSVPAPGVVAGRPIASCSSSVSQLVPSPVSPPTPHPVPASVQSSSTPRGPASDSTTRSRTSSWTAAHSSTSSSSAHRRSQRPPLSICTPPLTPATPAAATLHQCPPLIAVTTEHNTVAFDDDTIRESEEELRKVMKTVSASFAECHRTSATASPATRRPASSLATDDELDEEDDDDSSSDLMDQFMAELEFVCSDLVDAEELKSFRHSIQTASEASSPVLDDNMTPVATSCDVTATPCDVMTTQQHTVIVTVEPVQGSWYTRTTGGTAAAGSVPLAVLDEFCVGGTDSDDANFSMDQSATSLAAETRRSDFHKARLNNGPLSPDEQGVSETMTGPGGVGGDTCVLDMNSNDKEPKLAAVSVVESLRARRLQQQQQQQQQVNSTCTNPPATSATNTATAVATASRFDNWDPALLDEDDDTDDDSNYDMLEFAERYFNAHPIQHNQSAIVRTVHIVTRKSLNEFVPLEDLIRYSKSSTIPVSHVRMLDSDNVPIACSLFKDVHRLIRCSPTVSSYHVLVRSLILHCLQRIELRDELYCQLVRQTTNNPNSDEQRCRLWILFCLCAVSFSPSNTLRKYLTAHLRRVVRDSCNTEPTAPDATGQLHESKLALYAKYCLRHVATPRTEARRLPPSSCEIEAVSNLQPIVYRIHFLDGKTKAIVLDPSETAADALCRVSDKIGLQSTYGWALYESQPEHDRHVRSSEYLADILSDWEEKQKAQVASLVGTPKKSLIGGVGSGGRSSPHSKSPSPGPVQAFGKLVMCKRFCQRVGDIGDDSVELRLLYSQAVHYVVHLDEYQVPVSTSLHLAGLQAQADFGNFEQAKTARYAEPEEMLCQRVLLTDSRDWSQELAAAHKRFGKGKSTVDAMRKYLAVVSQFPLYGCTKVFAHYRGVWSYGVETIIAVNYDGIKLISVQEKKLAVDLYYSEIENIILEERNGECHVIFQLRNSISQGRQKTFLFECLELEELAALIECYSPTHATWTSRCNGNSGKTSWRSDQATVVRDWHRLYDNILRYRRLLLHNGIVRYPPQEEVGFLRSAFNRISGRNCRSLAHQRCGSESPAASETVEMSELNDAALHGAYWGFTKIPFKTSICVVQMHEIEDIAVRMFNSTLVYTGLELSAALDDKDLVIVMQTLIHKCMDNDTLCNEAYLQLIKQTTDTKTESSIRAVNQYWHLLCMVTCVLFPSSSIVLNYLRLHLQRYSLLTNCEEGKFAAFCAKNLSRTCQNHGRKFPPSYKEIHFVTKRQPLETRVYLADGHPILVEFDSAATAAEIIQMVKAKAGMRLDADGFALFQCIGEREDYIASEVKIADCFYQWEKSSRSNHIGGKDLKLILKKRLFLEPYVNLADPIEIDLLYHQSVSDVFDQKIPLTKSDAIQLCALRAQAEYGDHGHANNFDYNTVVRILPRHLRELTQASDIRAMHQTLVGTAPLMANVAFLEILKQWPLYGAIMFEVSSSLECLPKTIWLAVSQLGVHLMEFRGQTVYATYTFEEITGLTPASKSLTVTVSSEPPPSNALVFFTSEGAQIVQLISDYREVLARRRLPTMFVDDATDQLTGSRAVTQSNAAGHRAHRHRTAHKAPTTAAQSSSTTVGKRRDAQRTNRHHSPIVSSPEHDSTQPLLVQPPSSWPTSGQQQLQQSTRTHFKYQRVKDGSRQALKRTQLRTGRNADNKHEGIFE